MLNFPAQPGGNLADDCELFRRNGGGVIRPTHTCDVVQQGGRVSACGDVAHEGGLNISFFAAINGGSYIRHTCVCCVVIDCTQMCFRGIIDCALLPV